MLKNQYIADLNRIGQSVWYDNLSLSVLASGELGRLIDAGVSGLTSNPTIFKKAIADSTDYDQEVKNLSAKGLDDDGICEELMLEDVRQAADLLRSCYDQTKGADGYASIEVSPFLARDTEGTIAAALRLWKKLNRPNCMIKIPATKEGLPAIKRVLEEGINVNVTLIFSEEFYALVAEQYISALESRKSAGKSVAGISSVASFFVSRVDAICEKSFAELVKAGQARSDDLKQIFGKVGIANSRVAYARYKDLFESDRFKALASAGAVVQRPLWASTGTKNPDLSPVLYVEELAGNNTVNTMPPATLASLLNSAKIEPRLDRDLAEAKQVLQTTKKLGIDFDALLLELQSQGVELFAQSYRELLDSIATKRNKLSA